MMARSQAFASFCTDRGRSRLESQICSRCMSSASEQRLCREGPSHQNEQTPTNRLHVRLPYGS